MAVSVRLEPLADRRYPSWFRETTSGFVAQQVGSGAMAEREAREYAVQEFDAILPLGLHTPRHHVWTAYDGEVEVGYLWLGVTEQPGGVEAYVYDVAVPPLLQGRGYGRAIMVSGEKQADALGVDAVALNVFGHNRVARRLYDSLGYGVTETALTRSLATTEPMELRGGRDLRLVAKSTDDRASLPPDGRGAQRLLWTACDGEIEVGTVWWHLTSRSDGLHAHGYGLLVHPGSRRRSHDRAIMVAAERVCRERDVVSVSLSVRGSDRRPRSLYQQMGFRVTSTLMRKLLC